MLFRLRLRPLEEVEPWGGDQPVLHWFGLSDGWCWWQAGNQELFRYTQPVLDYWTAEVPERPKSLPYMDYQIVRPWEDLLDRLPDILEPVPDDLAERIEGKQTWQELQDGAWAWAEGRDDEHSWGLCNTAFLWWSERSWDAGFLCHPPKVWLWVQGDTFHLRWDNRAVTLDALPVWEATAGEIILPVSAFVEEVRSFHERFMAAMSERVVAVLAGGLRQDIKIDLDQLVREQQDRSTWLTNALNRKPPEQDWDKVRRAINTVERICYNNGVEGL